MGREIKPINNSKKEHCILISVAGYIKLYVEADRKKNIKSIIDKLNDGECMIDGDVIVDEHNKVYATVIDQSDNTEYTDYVDGNS